VWLAAALFSTQTAFSHTDVEQQILDASKEIERSPADAKLYVRRGELFRVNGRWEAAIADLNKAEKLDPTIENIKYFKGKTYLESGKPEAALPHLEAFLQNQPKNPDGLRLRARALVKLGRVLEAAESFTRAIQSINEMQGAPQPDDYLERARALATAGDEHLPKAIQGLDEGIARLGNVAILQLEAMRYEIKRASYDAALQRLDLIAAQSRRKDPWLARRADILLQAGRNADALDTYIQTLEAIQSLPASRRATKASAELEAHVRASIEKLKSERGTDAHQ